MVRLTGMVVGSVHIYSGWMAIHVYNLCVSFSFVAVVGNETVENPGYWVAHSMKAGEM